jgi:hypothetical protein
LRERNDGALPSLIAQAGDLWDVGDIAGLTAVSKELLNFTGRDDDRVIRNSAVLKRIAREILDENSD